MQQLRYGIDLGTRTNLIALHYSERDGADPKTEIVEFGGNFGTTYPSHIFADEQHLSSGTRALEEFRSVAEGKQYQMIWEPKVILAESGGIDKEIMVGQRRWYLSDLLATLFTDLLDEAEKHFERLGINSLVVGMPVDYPDGCKTVMLEALCKAGIYQHIHEAKKQTLFLPEPVAASLTYTPNISGRENVFMFDFGGGTLDISIMDLHSRTDSEVRPHTVLAKGRFQYNEKNFAGANIDFLLFQHYATKVGRDNLYRAFTKNKIVDDETLYNTMRQEPEYGGSIYESLISIKERLSRDDSAKLTPRKIWLDTGKIEIPEVIITQYDLVYILTPIFNEIEIYIDTLFKTANISKFAINKVLPVGGSSAIPYVRAFLTHIFGAEKVKLHQQSKATQYVIEGLAYYGHEMQFLKKTVEDIVESDYGYLYGNNQFFPVLRANTPIKDTKIWETDIEKGVFVHVKAADMNSGFLTIRIAQKGVQIGTIDVNSMGSGYYNLYFEIDTQLGWLIVRLYDRHHKKWLNKNDAHVSLNTSSTDTSRPKITRTQNYKKDW